MKKILITGGAGFIGYHLANRLFETNHQIDLLDDFSRGVSDTQLLNLTENNRVRFINSNLLQSTIISELCHDYTCIYHLAAVIGVQHVLKSPFNVLTKNFQLLHNAIEIAKHQKELKRFVFTSTSEIYSGTLYHYGLKFPTPESTPLTVNDLNESRTSYMLSKIYGEAMCLHSGLPVTIIRPHNFYGPRMGLSHVIPELMKKVVDSDNGMVDVFSVNHKRTFCYIADAVEMIISLTESDQTIGEAYNIGNQDEEISMNELATLIIKTIGKDIHIYPKHSIVGSPKRRCPDMSRLNKVIPFVKTYPLEKGLSETYNWYDKNIFSGKGISAI